VNWIDLLGLQVEEGMQSKKAGVENANQCGQNRCNQGWADCYTNCINTLAPGLTEFFVGSQVAVNAPYNPVIRPGPGGQLTFRLLPHPVASLYPRLWQAGATVSEIAKPIQGAALSWAAGVSYGCMISCLLDPCSY
jgi:hypothetical protein